MSARYRLVVERVSGSALVDNPLGDPVDRDLPLLVPEELDGPAPLVFALAGYGGLGRQMLADDPWSEGLQQRVERLAAAGAIGPMIFALPDCFTRLGGAQYLNSSATGRYEDYLWDDLLPWVRSRFPVGRIGLVGRSSGGFGALVQGMRHPDIVSAVACHSGDMGFEYCYLPDIPRFLRAVWRHGSVSAFLAHFAASHKKRDGRLLGTISFIAMAACYSPDPSEPEGIAFPCDLETGALRPDVWQRWLDRDPVRLVERPEIVEALRRLRLLFVDCGNADEFHLDIGARILSSRLRALGLPHVHETFDDGHMGIAYRLDASLPRLWEALRS